MIPLRTGFLAALGAPALAMGATFLAFGAASAEAGLGLAWALAASLLVYGMAGQVVLLQLVGTPVAGAVLGATAANARFFPMAVAIAPWLGPHRARRWLALPFIAITPWAAGMRHLPALDPAARLPWFLGFALASWFGAAGATALGHGLAPRRAMLLGAAAAPLALWLPPAWGLLAAGLIGGTAAWAWGRRA